MKNILILFFTLTLAAPLFSHAMDTKADDKESDGAITREAEKLDSKLKHKLGKAKKDVNSELCSTGEEQCSVKSKHKKMKKSAAPATSPNSIENKDQAD